MASRYWVGGSASWDGIALLKWSATSGGIGGEAIPTSADDVFIDANSGAVTVTMATGNTGCKNLDFTGFTGTFAGSAAFTISGSLTMVAGMTRSYTGTWTFDSSTASTITTGGKTFGSSSVYNGTGSWQLQDNLTSTSSIGVNLTAGTIDINGKVLTAYLLSTSNSNTRGLTFGGGSVSLTGNGVTVLSGGTLTGMTVTGTSVFNLTYAGATGNRTVSWGNTAGSSVNRSVNVNVTAGTDNIVISNASVIRALNFTGFAGAYTGTTNSISLTGSLTAVTGMTWSNTGTLSFTGTSGTQVITTGGLTFANNITCNGSGGTFQFGDTHSNGAANTLTLTAGTLDLNGKTVTIGLFAASGAVTRALSYNGGNLTLTGNAATVYDTTTTTSMTLTGTPVVNLTYSGSTGTRTISPGARSEVNTVSFNVSAGSDIFTDTASNTVKDLNFTGFTGTWSNVVRTLYGSLTIASGMTVTAGANATTLAATSGTKTITSAGKTLDFPLTINGAAGTFQLADALTLGSTRALTLTNGTFSAVTYDVAIGSFALGSGTKTLTLGTGTWTAAAAGASAWDAATNVTNLTVSASTATISMTSASAKTFAGGGKTWPTLNQGGAGTLTVTGSNTFTDITDTTTGATLTLTSGTTTTVSALSFGTATLNSSSGGSAATLSKASGTVTVTGLTITDSTATGGATWNAFTSDGNEDGGGNSGWVFAAPGGGGSGLSLGSGLFHNSGLWGGHTGLWGGTTGLTMGSEVNPFAGYSVLFNDDFDTLNLRIPETPLADTGNNQTRYAGTTMEGTGVWQSGYLFDGNGRGQSFSGENAFLLNPQWGWSVDYPAPLSVASSRLTLRAGLIAGTGLDGLIPVAVPAYTRYSGIVTSQNGAYVSLPFAAELTAKLPDGKGAAAAFWTIPQNSGLQLEIDIMEGLGGTNTGYNISLHYNSSEGGPLSHWPADGNGYWVDTEALFGVSDVTAADHSYSVVADETEISFYFDRQFVASVPTPAPFLTAGVEWYFALPFSVGSGYSGQPDGTTPDPMTFEIDSFKLYSKPATTYYIEPYTAWKQALDVALMGGGTEDLYNWYQANTGSRVALVAQAPGNVTVNTQAQADAIVGKLYEGTVTVTPTENLDVADFGAICPTLDWDASETKNCLMINDSAFTVRVHHFDLDGNNQVGSFGQRSQSFARFVTVDHGKVTRAGGDAFRPTLDGTWQFNMCHDMMAWDEATYGPYFAGDPDQGKYPHQDTNQPQRANVNVSYNYLGGNNGDSATSGLTLWLTDTAQMYGLTLTYNYSSGGASYPIQVQVPSNTANDPGEFGYPSGYILNNIVETNYGNYPATPWSSAIPSGARDDTDRPLLITGGNVFQDGSAIPVAPTNTTPAYYSQFNNPGSAATLDQDIPYWGEGWELVTGYAPANYAKVNSSLRVYFPSANQVWRSTKANADADYRARGQFKKISTIAGDIVGVMIRCQDAANTFYGLIWSEAAQKVQMFKRVAGADTPLGTDYSTTWSVAALKRLELNITGTSLTGYVNGTSRITATDSDAALTSAGRPGFGNPDGVIQASGTGIQLCQFECYG